MIQLLVLLLTLPTLLVPPGMCVCRFTPGSPARTSLASTVSPASFEQATPAKADRCVRGCCRSAEKSDHKQPENSPSRDGGHNSTPPAPQPDAPCCLTAHTASHSKISEHAVSWFAVLAFAAVVLVTFEPSAAAAGASSFAESPPVASQPAYISFCTLLI